MENIKIYNKELYEYKLDLLYYGIYITNNCYNSLRKGSHNQINNNDYITTKGLMLSLESKVYVNAKLNKNSPYKLDYQEGKYLLYHNDKFICNLNILQPPDFALQSKTLDNGQEITKLVNVHGDRIRIQPIEGCANKCSFCDLNSLSYKRYAIKDLERAFIYVLEHVGFRHVLISGGTPLSTKEDYDYSNNVYKYFGEKYGKLFPIDVMLVPRGLTVGKTTEESYKEFLNKLKDWNIGGVYINLELYNDDLRKKYIPEKELVGKERYFQFIKLAVEIFGKDKVKSCIVIGLEPVRDSLKAVEELSKLGCMPVLSPYIPNIKNTFFPKPELMKEVLLKSQEIVDKYDVKLGPLCPSCKHNTIHFQ